MTTPAAPCTHGLTFPTEPEAERAVLQHLTVSEIREAWPRLDGDCQLGCGYRGIAYANVAHFVAGDW